MDIQPTRWFTPWRGVGKINSPNKKDSSVITKQQTLNDESLETVMCEVEAILNNRPLTASSGDPMTWNHLRPITYCS